MRPLIEYQPIVLEIYDIKQRDLTIRLFLVPDFS